MSSPPPPPAVAQPAAAPGGLPAPNTFRVQQEQQRPSLSYFLFLSLLFFMLNNNNSSAGELTTSGPASIEGLHAALLRREMRRDGLAQWAGANTTYYNATSNATIVAFEPKESFNPVAQKVLGGLVVPPTPGLHFPQNLTGFIPRGSWSPGEWTYAKLGLEETFNTTMVVPVREKEATEGDDASKEEVAAPVSSKLVERDEPPEGETALEREATAPPKMENKTVRTNRTELRNYFDFSGGGKMNWNLREWQSTVVGPVLPSPEGEDPGTLMQTRLGNREDWERDGPVVYLRGDITVNSNDRMTDLQLEIEAVHFLSLGTVYGYATGPSAPSHVFKIPSLPLHLISSPYNVTHAHAASRAVLVELDSRIAATHKELEAGNYGSLQPSVPSPFTPSNEDACNFVLVAQLAALPQSFSQTSYAEYYASLFHPTGSSILTPPNPKISYALYSEECGLLLEGEGEGLPSPRMWSRATNLGMVLGAAQIVLVLLLVKQMETRGSASACNRVAYSTIGLQAAIDSYFFVITFTVGVVTNNRASMPLLLPAFVAFVSSLLFGMSYAQKIRAAMPVTYTPPRPVPPPPPPPPTTAQLSAAAAERRAEAATASSDPPAAGEAETDALLAATPVGVAAPDPSSSTSGADERGDAFFIGVGMAIAISALTVIIIWGWITLMVCILYSYWVPQIIHNVQRGNARLALRRSYVIGTTICRLVLPLYVWGCPHNILSIETSGWVYILTIYSLFQAFILLLQDSRLGARFFIPPAYRPSFGLTEETTWNYHPPLPGGDEENPVGTEVVECPICMEEIERPNKEEVESGGAKEFRWSYMVPPCHHVCHTQCLESWMQIKSVCPVCRGRLPPV